MAGGEGGADVLPAGVKGAKKRKAAVKAAEEEVKKKRAAVDRQVKKKVASKKLALEKEAVIYFQRRFEGPLGKGLRLFHPEPAKGGNSNTGEIFRLYLCSFLYLPTLLLLICAGVTANRFFMNAEATGVVLHLPPRVIAECCNLLRQLNSVNHMVDVEEFQRSARNLWTCVEVLVEAVLVLLKVVEVVMVKLVEVVLVLVFVDMVVPVLVPSAGADGGGSAGGAHYDPPPAGLRDVPRDDCKHALPLHPYCRLDPVNHHRQAHPCLLRHLPGHPHDPLPLQVGPAGARPTARPPDRGHHRVRPQDGQAHEDLLLQVSL